MLTTHDILFWYVGYANKGISHQTLYAFYHIKYVRINKKIINILWFHIKNCDFDIKMHVCVQM